MVTKSDAQANHGATLQKIGEDRKHQIEAAIVRFSFVLFYFVCFVCFVISFNTSKPKTKTKTKQSNESEKEDGAL